MAFLGFVDDMLGQGILWDFAGISACLFKKGNLYRSLEGMGGGIIAVYASFLFRTLRILSKCPGYALFTNCMNLFDLRPGRCIKAFVLIFLPMLAYSGSYLILFIPIAGAVLAYFPYDVKSRVMMGDTGSNVLGVTLGVMAVYGLELPTRLLLLVVLILLHIFTERYSLSKIIDNNRFLRWFDRLGRSDGSTG